MTSVKIEIASVGAVPSMRSSTPGGTWNIRTRVWIGEGTVEGLRAKLATLQAKYPGRKLRVTEHGKPITL